MNLRLACKALSLFVISTLVCFGSLKADEPDEDYKNQQQDLKAYIEVLDSFQNAPLKEKIQGLKQFLEDNPDTTYRNEIRKNIENMESVLRAEEEKKLSAQAKDKQEYESFKGKIAGLPIEEQIAKYEEFINTHQESSMLEEANKDLETLKEGAKTAKAIPKKVGKEAEKAPTEPLAPSIKTKDVNHAIFMATVPGFFVPGMGSFYAGDPYTGAALVIVRVAGYGMAAAGIAKNRQGLMITGIIAAGVSYLVDIAAAPVLARDYNEKLEKKTSSKIEPFITVTNNGPLLGLNVDF